MFLFLSCFLSITYRSAPQDKRAWFYPVDVNLFLTNSLYLPPSFLSPLPPLHFLLPPSFSSFSLLTLALALTCVPGFSLASQQPLMPEDSDQGTHCPVATQHHLLIMPFSAFSASNGMRKLMRSSDLLHSISKKGLSAFLSSIFSLGRDGCWQSHVRSAVISVFSVSSLTALWPPPNFRALYCTWQVLNSSVGNKDGISF